MSKVPIAARKKNSQLKFRYAISRNKIHIKHENKRRLALEENKLQYELQALIKKENKKSEIGKYRVVLTAKLATLLCDVLKLGPAEKLLRDLLVQCSNELEQNHHYTISTAINLSSVLRKQGKLMQAKGLCAWTLRVNMKTYGKYHTRTLLSVSVMAQILIQYSAMNHNVFVKEEEKLWRWALQGAHRNFGMNHPSTFYAVANLSDFCWRYGKKVETEALLRKSLSGLPNDSQLRYHPIVFHLVQELIIVLQDKKLQQPQQQSMCIMNDNKNSIKKTSHEVPEYSALVDEVELENLIKWEASRSSMEDNRLVHVFEEYELEHAIQFKKYYGSKK
jgi:hypothetical protein